MICAAAAATANLFSQSFLPSYVRNEQRQKQCKICKRNKILIPCRQEKMGYNIVEKYGSNCNCSIKLLFKNTTINHHSRVFPSLAALTCHTITYSRIVFVVAAHGWIDATYARHRVFCASLCSCCCFVFSLASIMLLFIQQFCCRCCCWPKQLVRQAWEQTNGRGVKRATHRLMWLDKNGAQYGASDWGGAGGGVPASRLSGAPCWDAELPRWRPEDAARAHSTDSAFLF